MASIINAKTTGGGGIETVGDASGVLQLQSNGVTVATISSTGLSTQVGAPAFSAYLSSNQSITTTTATKMQCNTEEFDTNSNYNTSTYSFTPTVAGYYQVNVRCAITINNASGLISSIYKNGSEIKRGNDYRATISAGTGASASALVYMNGTTDYLEFYALVIGTSPTIEGGVAIATYFQAAMVRSA